MKRTYKILFIMAVCQMTVLVSCFAWKGMRMPELFINGRYLMAKDIKGNDSIVNLHGFGQTYSPYFNGYAWCKDSYGNVDWSRSAQYNYTKCLAWNELQIKNMLNAGWKVNWLRLHMDPHWTNDPDVKQTGGGGESDITAFSLSRLKLYLKYLFIPMVKYAIDNGIYVVMRPPGVCPKEIAVGDDYQKYLIEVWTTVCSDSYLKNNPYVMFELANEPVTVKGDDGTYSSSSNSSLKNCTRFFQDIVDAIRATGSNNILWVPGTGYQSLYQGYVKYPIEGENIGFAVHCYPGWYGSDSEADDGSAEQGIVTKGNTYSDFQAGWSNQIEGAANLRPILVTEMDWAPKKYNSSWGKATTGTLGGVGFGNNFRYIMDKTGNVSWMLFTDADKLAQYNDAAADGATFLTDPEACPRPCYRWYKEYASGNWKFEDTLADNLFMFPGTSSVFNASIWETGTLIKNSDGTHTLTTGQYGFGGWKFAGGCDMSAYKYLVLQLKSKPASTSWSLRLFDVDNYWSAPYMKSVGSTTQVVVPLQSMKTENGSVVDPSHIYILGLWSYGFTPITIKDIYLTNENDLSNPTALDNVICDLPGVTDNVRYNLAGQRVTTIRKGGIYITKGKKVLSR